MKVDRSLDKYKSRIVAKGFQQTEGLDYTETFCPVDKPTTVHTVLSLVLSHHWLIQLDVNIAFLNGDSKEEVFMAQPQSFEDPQYPHYVCKLKKIIYDLK